MLDFRTAEWYNYSMGKEGRNKGSKGLRKPLKSHRAAVIARTRPGLPPTTYQFPKLIPEIEAYLDSLEDVRKHWRF